ncbi:hypothetical protein [Salibacterium qingdaonense]|uniref:hypothetical protein n=1 Tax=Salibacterium qingdaonense TaxID=266892 RepID=UPI0015A608C5|nr:hypothetical protein [Salibacterium qingdaonense]
MTNPEEHFESCTTLFKECLEEYRPAGTIIGVQAMALYHPLIEVRAAAYAVW